MANSTQINNKGHLIFASLSMALAVSLGALAAHALQSWLSPEKIASFQTAVRYQIIHSLAIFILAILSTREIKIPSYLFVLFKLGIVLFSGSIYALSTLPIHNIEFFKFLGPVTPIGGLCFIAGWIALALSFRK
jgi:uncharacterized membrane protein YgdD (TMEM256/DUF423 family)